jgi:hypothetical protein
MMKTKNFKGLVFGDVHLFHPHTTSDHVVSVLYELVNDFKDFADLDVIVIEGDLFDSLMPYNSTYVKIIEKWMTDLLIACAKHDVALRALEGTPSHDMRQTAAIVKLKENLGLDVDLRYIEDIEIEVNEERGWTIGYVPDEMESPLSKCYDRMVALMAERGLTKLDFMVMHGSFEFQFPSYFDVDSHSSSLWMELVNFYIFIGHVHDRAVYGNIIASGSIDRFRHNEEKPKGITYFETNDTVCSYRFIDNKRSKIYTTLDVSHISEETLSRFTDTLKKLPPKSHIRFRTQNRLDAANLISYFEKLFPLIIFTFIVSDVKDKQKTKQLVYPTFDHFNSERIKLTKENLADLLLNELIKKPELAKREERAREILNGHIK